MTNDKVLASIDAEESVLGAVIIDGGLYSQLELSSDDFYIDRHAIIWSAFGAIHRRGLAIDLMTVTDELDGRGKLAIVGGAAALTAIVNRVVTTYNASSYVAIVKDYAARRQQVVIANEIAQGAWNGGVDVASVIDALSETGGWQRPGRMIGDGLSSLYDNVMQRAASPKDIWGIKTGFIDLDKLLGGLQKHQLVLIAGDPGVGKTTLVLQSALAAAKAGFHVAIFELEMDEQACLRRFVEIETGVPNRAMLSGRMGDYMDMFTSAMTRLEKLPIYINDNPMVSTAEMRGELARLRARHPVDLVIVDYINKLKDTVGDGRDNNANNAAKAERVRDICRDMGLAGLSIQSLTKEGMRSTVKRLADMAGPADVHFGADAVLFLVSDPDRPDSNVYHLLPSKQRHGDQGNKPIPLIRNGLAFRDAVTNSVALDYLSDI